MSEKIEGEMLHNCWLSDKDLDTISLCLELALTNLGSLQLRAAKMGFPIPNKESILEVKKALTKNWKGLENA